VICSSCKTENDDEAEHCIHCGKGLYALVRGDVLSGRWEIRDILGTGGMGVVYKAHDRDLDEIVAVKVIKAGVAATSPEMSKRFRSEIKLARRVRHPNVCGIHEYGQDQHRRFIVMEHIEGVDYRQILRQRGFLPADEAFDVAIQVGEGLDAIHRAGIVHRDLKTPNIMRDSKGVVRLMDFGIAKQYDAAASTGATRTGHIVGTPEYMSPEQARGEAVDPRSDVYALGVVTYELFTGHVPFRGDTPVATLLMHFQTPPPLEGISRLPPALVPILKKALSKDREDRFASCSDMSGALRKARDQTVPLGSPPSARSSPRVEPRPTPSTSYTPASDATRVRPPETATQRLSTAEQERAARGGTPAGGTPLSMRRPGDSGSRPLGSALTPTPGRMKRPPDAKIGILLWSPQIRYQQCRDGVIEELREEGFVEPEVQITVEHADSQAQAVASIAQRFVSSGMNVLIPVGTSAIVRVAAEVKDVPVVFAFAFDPVASKVAQSWKSSGNNTTGSSSKTPAPLLVEWLRKLAPVKSLAVLYTPGETNTEAQLADFQRLKDPDLRIVPTPIASRGDIAEAIPRLEGSADAVLLTGGTIIGEGTAQIVLLANKARILTCTQSQGFESRVVLGVTVNPNAVGRLAGRKCAMVLRGTRPAAIEIEALDTSDVTVNPRVAKALGLELPESVRKAATRVVQ
jgi:serine/threonine protein kinase/ABC-type uncharacterized transport system substrate-binding protein